METSDLKRKMIINVLNAGAMSIRNVDNGDDPFLYASGNYGPGYVSIKGLIGRKLIIKLLLRELAILVGKESFCLHFVAGNVTGGLAPGWILSEYLETYLDRTVPFVYVRDARKKGGHKELITGITNNPEISKGNNVLVVEELVNFAETTCNSAEILREEGYKVSHAACILFYNNPNAVELLKKHNVKMVCLFTLEDLLKVAEEEEIYSEKLIAAYRNFLKDPLAWQAERGLEPIKDGGTK